MGGFLPVSPFEVSDESLSFCKGMVSSQLLLPLPDGPNTGGYVVEALFQNRNGLTGSTKGDFTVVFSQNGGKTRRLKYDLLLQGIGGQATARGISFSMPATTAVGLIDIQACVRSTKPLAEHGWVKSICWVL